MPLKATNTPYGTFPYPIRWGHMSIFSFIVSLAILLILLGIGANQGFSVEVFLGLIIAGGSFIVELVRALFNGPSL